MSSIILGRERMRDILDVNGKAQNKNSKFLLIIEPTGKFEKQNGSIIKCS